jgi:hypothetical protein
MPSLVETEHEYRNETAGLSYSQLKDLLASPAIFYAKYIAKTMPAKESYAMDFGTKAHHMLLMPNAFEAEYKFFTTYLALPKTEYTRLKGRCQWQEVDSSLVPDDEFVYFHEAKSDEPKKTQVDRLEKFYGKQIVLPSETRTFTKLIKELKLNPQTLAVINNVTETETALTTVFDDEPIKGKLDYIAGNSVGDYKTCEHAIRPDLILSTILKLSYHLQAYIYFKLAKDNNKDVDSFHWIFQNKASGQCAVVPCTKELLDMGARDFERAIRVYHQCMDTGLWADYVDENGNTNYDAPLDLTAAMERKFNTRSK